MAAVASTYTLPADPRRPHADFLAKRSFSSPLTRLATGEGHGTVYAGTGTRQKRSWSPGAKAGVSMETAMPRDEDSSSPQVRTPNARPRSWLRRFSSSMSTSRDSSRTPTSSRPGSAAVPSSNGSLSLSRSGSTTLMFPDNTPPQAQPNKLVKRTSSLHSSNASPFQPSGSKLPLPVLRRPLTSHARAATLPERTPEDESFDRMSIDQRSDAAREPQWRQYFTPKSAQDENHFGRRLGSSGIPNPIKRMYPDRRYTPVLLSAKQAVLPADLELDDGDGGSMGANTAPSVASPSVPASEPSAPRRSFSIGDLLSLGPQPSAGKRPTSSKGKATTSKLARRVRPRVVSAPVLAQPDSMGSASSKATSHDADRPAKRRDVTDPRAGHRAIYSSPSNVQPAEPQLREFQLNLAATTPSFKQSPFPDSPLGGTLSQAITPSSLEQRRLPSANVDSSAARHARVSAAQSEIAPSTVGSDSEQRSADGYSTDYQSDTFFDSYPTRTTRSSAGKRGPPIDTIFDESPPPSFSSGRSTKLRDLLNDGQFLELDANGRHRHSTIEEEESVMSTPVRSLHDKSMNSTPSARPGAQQAFASSPPIMSGTDEIDWDAPEDAPMSGQGLGIQQEPSTPAHQPSATRAAPFRFGALQKNGNAVSSNSTPARHSNGGPNLFDWSEQQPSPSHHDQSPPRPRTMHGKKDPADRGSRSTGRRAPSGIHARSHSVPIAPDVDGKRSVVANKFGTWGVGSKAVTEDWNEDFEFEEQIPPVPELNRALIEEKRIDSGHEMFVPKSIREQQESVVANIGLLREWGLLIEELKELRVRAVALDMLSGPHAKAWQEVDAMIELADQESEEATLQPRRSPPASPGFDFDAFDEELTDVPMLDQSKESSIKDFVLDDSEDEADRLPPIPTIPAHFATQLPVTRPRKDSEAVARSVIEALQTKRSVSDPTALHPAPPVKKVPFDTATLRHIVPYVNGLKRKVKDALRETEGLYSSPHRRPPLEDGHVGVRMADTEPAFLRSMFNERGPDSPTSKRILRRDEAITDNDESDDPWADEATNLASRMERMNLSGAKRA
ncbi:hypothetical protein LTR53_007965 [Teratosphaeriaceae sp. CCFEE 6253]|nr:hypothetical protein LTR53_007965 [Teratosphaeriaceae sp. CCFEE 6253]